ncbi:unnamed protein product [Symbiodinium natans]|uniref:Uncharacterized protein n=1 Tax=Symbiodinium natans TaxID=878477 RepID=A0A812T7B1_9DINO|nr:unnamed protein product [Symbiodinium natans]
MFKPITEILYEHPGEDTWCIIGKAGNRSLACALARKHRDMRAYVEYNHQRAELAGQVAALAQPRKVALPDGSTLKVRDYDDLFCMINGYYNMSREEALNDYEALTHMSEHFCSISKELVPDYNRLSLGYLVEESPAHARYIKSLLMSDRPVEHLNQSDIDVFRTEAAIQCRMDNDHGGNCDVAWCNYRGCLDADGVTVRQTDYGECPPV